MSVLEALEKVVGTLTTERQREVLDFAEFLSWQDDREGWRQFGKAQFAKAYGPNEPEYTTADLMPETGQ